MVGSLFGGSPRKAPRWDLADTDGCGSGIRFSWCSSMFSGYWSIYRRRRYVGGAMRGPRGWGARPPASWPPHEVPDFNSKSFGLLSVQERSSQRFHSVWIPFDIPFPQNTEIGKKTTICTGLSVNRLVPKII